MTLYAGPWCGEFGYEIMAWQANVREAAKGHDKVVVGCVPESRALYADFATEFWDVEFDHNTSGATRMDRTHVEVCRRFHDAAVSEGASTTILPPKLYGRHESRGEFIQYGDPSGHVAYDVLIHARDMVKGSKGGDRRRCATREFWEYLGEVLDHMNVASIGLPDLSLCVPGTIDLRGISMQALMDTLSASKLVVGATSGPIHLAALCNCPQVVWTDTHRLIDGYTSKDRVEGIWNPFRVPVQVIHVDYGPEKRWEPTIGSVLGAIGKLHERATA